MFSNVNKTFSQLVTKPCFKSTTWHKTWIDMINIVHRCSDSEGKGPCAIVPLTWKMAHQSLCRVIRNGPLKISKSLKKAENGPLSKISSQTLQMINSHGNIPTYWDYFWMALQCMPIFMTHRSILVILSSHIFVTNILTFALLISTGTTTPPPPTSSEFSKYTFPFSENHISRLFGIIRGIFMPPDRMIGGILFLSCLFVCLSVCLSVCLFVCLSVVNFNIRYNFWTVRGRDFIFGMHTPLMMTFQMTPRSMTLWPWLWPLL